MTAKMTFVGRKAAQAEEWKDTEEAIMTRKKEDIVEDKRWQKSVTPKQNNLL